MARIRTIKPEFFTSEDVVALSPFARLLYVALWCESDKEGRMVWKPRTFKMRYFPADDLDIDALCKELLDAHLVVLYGEGYAWIPTFKAHQHINPRETPSQLPEPDASTTRRPRVGTRQSRDSDAQGGREGKDIGSASKTRQHIQFDGRQFLNIATEQREAWQRAYPALSLDAELAKAAAWLIANPSRQKSNYARFLTNWMTNARPSVPVRDLNDGIVG